MKMPKNAFLRVWVIWSFLTTIYFGLYWIGWTIALILQNEPTISERIEGVISGLFSSYIAGAQSSIVFFWISIPLHIFLIRKLASNNKLTSDLKDLKKITWILFWMSMFAIWIEPIVTLDFTFIVGFIFSGVGFFFLICDIVVTTIWAWLHFQLLRGLKEEYRYLNTTNTSREIKKAASHSRAETDS